MKNYGFLIASSFLLLAELSCEKITCIREDFSFHALIAATPNEENTTREDTIWLQIEHPTTFRDQLSNTEVDFSNAENFGITLGFGEIVDNQVEFAVEKFSILVEEGTEIEPAAPEKNRAFNFLEKDGVYLLNIGIIPKDTGHYYLYVHDGYGSKNNGCKRADVRLKFDESTDQHLDLYQKLLPNSELSEFDRERIYAFEVR